MSVHICLESMSSKHPIKFFTTLFQVKCFATVKALSVVYIYITPLVSKYFMMDYIIKFWIKCYIIKYALILECVAFVEKIFYEKELTQWLGLIFFIINFFFKKR
jgi:ABC-type protease/lipase transport system fused ATPase/permease subunit